MQDEVIYRCIHAACAQALPRKVNFCPYCGTDQELRAAGQGPGPRLPGVPPLARVAASQPLPTPAAPAPRAPSANARAAVPAPPVPAQAQVPGQAQAQVPAQVPARSPGAARRKPVRLRYCLLALGAFWVAWMVDNPAGRRIDARIDHAIALTNACRFDQARAELVELRSAKAGPEQLQRLQGAIDEALAACARKGQRKKPLASRRDRVFQ